MSEGFSTSEEAEEVMFSAYGAMNILWTICGGHDDYPEDETGWGKALALWSASRMQRLDDSQIPEIIHKAAQENDVEFFKRLGRALKDPPLPVQDPEKVGRVAPLLVDHWILVDGDKPGLCFYSNEALCEFCMVRLQRMDDDKGRNREAMSKQIKRWIKRLGLVKVSPARITR